MTRRASVTMVELESQDAATMEVASAKHVTATVALRVGAAVASLAAAVLVVTNRQERWGVEVNFTMFDVWVYVSLAMQLVHAPSFVDSLIRSIDLDLPSASATSESMSDLFLFRG